MKLFFNNPQGDRGQPMAPHAGRDLPNEAPLAMPIQDFAECPGKPLRPASAPFGVDERRMILLTATFAITCVSLAEMLRISLPGGISVTEAMLMLLFLPLFAWIALSFCSATAGFVTLVRNRREATLISDNPMLPRERTAVLMPIYNEDTEAVFRRLKAIIASIEAEGARDCFDLFVLSDTTDLEIAAAEREAFLRLQARSGVTVHYRRRPMNTERKPGNIAEWVRRFGSAYAYMVVLDADSLMSGRSLVQLADAMEHNPGVGLIQSVPSVVGCATFFARWQQFAARLYGPVATAGLLWWSGSEGSFWGHNAIVRVRAFAESCGLPALSGPAPFGGHIFSHDMVEAALLRRRGWGVHMVTLPEGSYEEYPPTLIDYAVRDRRWCQGNLQHIRLLNSRGFHWISRLHLLMGASAYFTSPLWLLLLVASLAQTAQSGLTGGLWTPLADISGWLLVLTAILLFGPKVMSLAWTLSSKERSAQFGGRRKMLASVAIDMPLAAVLAPAVMLTQIQSLAGLLLGRSSGWAAQRRDVSRITFGEALRFYHLHMLLGLVIAGVCFAAPNLLMWMALVVLGLVASPWLVMLTSRRDLGDWTRRLELFATPEELSPGRLLRQGLPAPTELKALPLHTAVEPQMWTSVPQRR